MEIDFEVMSVVAERLEAEISNGALNAAVTIGTGKCGNVFRLQVISPEDAEEEDVADVPEWARCIATSNAALTGAEGVREANEEAEREAERRAEHDAEMRADAFGV